MTGNGQPKEGRMANIYEVTNKDTGQVVVTDIARRCEDVVPLSAKMIREIARENKTHGKYSVRIVGKSPNVSQDGETADAIRAWDTFCEPLRKKYGVEVNKHDE